MEKRFNDDLARQIGEVLRKIRISQDGCISQADVADFAGISDRYYAYLEAGKRMPSFEVVLKIAKAYNIPLSEFCKTFDNLIF